MKKTALTMAISGLLLAGGAQASTVYNQDGTKLDIGGRVQGMYYGSDDDSITNDQSFLRLKIDGDEGEYGFSIDVGDGRGWQNVASKVDGTVLSTDRAGGFVGALLGPFARDERSSRSE